MRWAGGDDFESEGNPAMGFLWAGLFALAMVVLVVLAAWAKGLLR